MIFGLIKKLYAAFKGHHVNTERLKAKPWLKKDGLACTIYKMDFMAKS